MIKIVYAYMNYFDGTRELRQEGEFPDNIIWINYSMSPIRKFKVIVHELMHYSIDLLDWMMETAFNKLLDVNTLHSLIDGDYIPNNSTRTER